jgi:hypothetical protein
MMRLCGAAVALAVLWSVHGLCREGPKQPANPSTRLPRFYGLLGLKPDQEKDVRQTRARYQKTIEDLKRQIQTLQKEEDAALEKFLTEAQKAKLKELRAKGPGEFKVSGPKRVFTVRRGQSTTFGVELSHDAGFEGEVRLTFQDIPKGVTISPSPFVFKERGDPVAQLTLTVAKDAVVDEQRFTILATPDYGEPVEVPVKVLIYP